MQMLHLKTVPCFLHVKQINVVFIDETNHIYITIRNAYVQFD